MYRAFIDGRKLYDPENGFYLESPKVSLELNKTGTFDFTIRPDHPEYGNLRKLTGIVTVYDRNQLVFRGRVLSDEEGFRGERKVSCEGELAFLLDSVVRPYDWQGGLEELFSRLITQHNNQMPDEARHFAVGRVTVTDPNDYVHYSSTTYPTTWDEINEKLVKTHGGYLNVRHEEDATYIDYLADFDLLSAQPVTFGSNLLDVAKTTRADDVATAVVPLGKRAESTEDPETGETVEGKRLTIESVNDGKDYIQDDEAVKNYGLIFSVQTWDDVTEAANLKSKGEEWLAQAKTPEVELELSAVDLAALNADFGSFHLGTYVQVHSSPHGLDRNFLVSKLSIDLSKPDSNKLSLGATYSAFTEQTAGMGTTVSQSASKVDNIVIDVSNQVQSSVSQSSDYILQTVAENYYLKGDADALVSSVNTRFAQTADQFEFSFQELSKDIQDVASGNDARFSDIIKYIRFVDGNIVLGGDGARVSFVDGGREIAYLSGSKLHVRDGEYLDSLKLGSFAFKPRANGNLSFGKVVN